MSSTPRFAMSDTRKPDGCYVQFSRLIMEDNDASPRDYLFQDPDYAEEDADRLRTFQRGDWSFIGVRAVARCFIVQNGVGTYVNLESPGLWGIESESNSDYLDDVYAEEVNHLKGLIGAMGAPQYEEA